jgi:hypothetical protein
MKIKIIIAIILMVIIGVCNAHAQRMVFQETTTQTTGSKKDTLVTKYDKEDSQGNKYPIIINKKSGSCYYWRKSSKTGKMYKSYLKPEDSEKISKEYGITYAPRRKG